MSILLLFTGFIIAFAILFYYEYKIRQIRRTEPKNKVYFYVARDMDSRIYLYLGKPLRRNVEFGTTAKCKCIASEEDFKNFNLDIKDFKDLKWEDEPVEVFLNMED